MTFKFFKKLFESPIAEAYKDFVEKDAWEEVKPLPKVKRTRRRGMNKNFRVGRIKHISQDQTKMLIDVLEMCHNESDGMYEARYNMWVHFDKEWASVVSKCRAGQYVVFGFYIQSFRNKALSDVYENVMTVRFINLIPEEDAKSLAIDLSESSLFVDHAYLKLSNVKFSI